LDIFLWVLQAVLILLGIGIIGFWVARRNAIAENVQGFLIQLSLNIALPCMVFSSIIVNFSPEKYPDWWQLPLYWIGFAAISLVLTLITMFVSRKETRGEFAINLLYQNGLFFPLIIIGGVFGAESPYLPQLYLFGLLHPIMFFSTYRFFFKKARAQKTPWHRIINPILVATILAMIVRLMGVNTYLPKFVYSILETLGAMAVPLVMIILGGSLYLDFKQRGSIYYTEIIKFLAIKNILFPLVLIGILLLWRPAYNIALLFFLESVVPPVTATPILTERAGGNKAISTQFVLSSFIFSIVAVPSMFRLFSQFFPLP
jgi:predicted permease